MARYYVPTFLTDLYMGKGKRFTESYPGICTGAQFLTQFPEYDIKKTDVSAENQTRWDDNPGKMKAFFDWGHIDAGTAHVIYPNVYAGSGPSASVNFGNSTVIANAPAGSTLARAHRLSELRRPYGEFPGDADSTLPDPDGPHFHPETYNPGFAIPENGVYPYQLFVRELAGVRAYSHGTSGANGNPVIPWGDQSQQSPNWGSNGGGSGASRIYVRNIYQYGHFLSARGVTPRGGWFVYGLFGVSGSSEYQEYDMYWLEPVFYKVHDRYVIANYNQPPWLQGFQDLQDYFDLTSSGPWLNPSNWIARTSTETIEAGKYMLAGQNTTDPAPPGTYYFRLASGTAFPGDKPDTYDTWEWRGEYRLDKITPGLGYIKRREFAQVFPLMNIIREQEFIETTVTGLLREGETPLPKFREEEDSLILRKTIAEYGL